MDTHTLKQKYRNWYRHLTQNGNSRSKTWNYYGEDSDDDGGDDVPFDESNRATDNMSNDDLDEMLHNTCQSNLGW